MQHQAASMKRNLFNQDYLDEQFNELEELQDDDNPNFVEEVVNLFFTDSIRLIGSVDIALANEPYDFGRLDDLMHQFKGSSSSIGAKRVKRECSQFQEYCNERNIDGCKRAFQGVKQEYATLKTKLDAYFQAAREAS
ncbi:histidine-containing phosphotransfer protein 4-like [Solanum lycopersicum]|uniref:Histidine-containing phosphotransfer protein n=1 Tax=Solanum lycopersicum TaxID=4081 RepID=A0A3Q7HQV3_SOLLC|nr:histidine-containing phosphotransfer protein 4-like [Solanum lycopersicum]